MTTGTHIAPPGGPRAPLSGLTGRCAAMVWCVLWMWLGSPLPALAQSVSKEYQLKAAFLYNFTKFVDWPANRFAAPDSPIVIGITGENPFGDELAKAVAGRTQNGRAFVVTNLTSTNAFSAVHLLFVPMAEEATLKPYLPELHSAGVLTVGESEAFAAADGIINFTTEADKIRFEINLAEAERGGLKISSKLLQLAKIVRRKPSTNPAP